MNRLSTHIINVLLFAIVGLVSGSCIYDNDGGTDVDGQEALIVFKISTEGASAMQATDIIETVKSLRVIIIDERGRLDINEKVTLQAPEYAAKNFSYIFVGSLKPGTKRVYLVANEESAGEVQLTERTGIPDNIPLTSLTALLDWFGADPGNIAESGYTGKTFARVLDRVYFKNDYSRITSGNTIALPYSAYYEIDTEHYLQNGPDGEKGPEERPLYLVPVAAKFDFVFTNYRKYDAYVDDIVISSLNSHNYLNAQLDDSEKRRKLPDGTTNVWWIDWLEACARESQSAEDNGSFNQRWGWIAKYGMPVENEAMTELPLNSGKNVWMVERLVDKSNPSRISVGPFYVPESFNVPYPSSDGAGQSYSLTFKVHDGTGAEDAEEVTTLSGYTLDALKALFRATHTIVYVQFYESKADIYAEIVPWSERLFMGYVQQDDD